MLPHTEDISDGSSSDTGSEDRSDSQASASDPPAKADSDDGGQDSVLQKLQRTEVLLAMERRRTAELEMQLRQRQRRREQQPQPLQPLVPPPPPQLHQREAYARERSAAAARPAGAPRDRDGGTRFLLPPDAPAAPPPAPAQAPPWRKILYERQPYRDNYVPPSFLSQLVANAHLRRPDLRQYTVNTAAVTQQISAVSLLLVVFMLAQDGTLSVPVMVAADLVLLFGGYATLAALERPAVIGATEPAERGSAVEGGGINDSGLSGVIDKTSGTSAGSGDPRRGNGILSSGGFSGNSEDSEGRRGSDPLNSHNGDDDGSFREALAVSSADGDSHGSLRRDDVAVAAAGGAMAAAIGSPAASGGPGVLPAAAAAAASERASAQARTLGSFALFLATLRTMAPVLRTLTVSYSDDTIYAQAITLSALHVAFHDYSYANGASTHFRGTLSLNAAMFATVLLASRLESNESVFALVLFAVELFAFFPLARHRVRQRSLFAHLAITVLLVAAAGALLLLRDATLFTVFAGTVAFVSFACPLWLVSIQRHKYHVEGPWDIAEVVDLE